MRGSLKNGSACGYGTLYRLVFQGYPGKVILCGSSVSKLWLSESFTAYVDE